MTEPLELRAPGRAFPFVFLVAGGIVLLNGIALLVVPLPGKDRWAFGPVALTFVGAIGIIAAVWSFRQQFQLSRLASLIEEDLPPIDTEPSSRRDGLRTILDRLVDVSNAAKSYPKAGVDLKLWINGREATIDRSMAGTWTVRAQLKGQDRSRVEAARASVIEGELIWSEDEAEETIAAVETLAGEIWGLPPDYEVRATIEVYRREDS
ncbi:MAG: hypothetical protein CME26_10595 [Gemmatimonadetes bacterium]|nr:hypothetical protein [Gemmatimonadota bacterium]